MSKYRDISVNLVTKLTIAIAINLCLIFPALAVTQQLQFDSTAGYRVEATFSYSDSKNFPVIRERGKGKTQNLESLQVSFYQPSGELIETYNNIVDSKVTGNYFEFNYDPATKKLLDNIDIGGESAGEMYLKGSADGDLSLIKVSNSGEESIISSLIISN